MKIIKDKDDKKILYKNNINKNNNKLKNQIIIIINKNNKI